MDDSASSSEADDFGVRCSSTDGVLILTAGGELDVFTAPRLAAAIGDGLAAARIALIVDLSNVRFLASAAMTVLLDGHDTAERSSKRLVVVADGPTTSRPMKLMGLDQELSLYATLDAALGDYRWTPTDAPVSSDSGSFERSDPWHTRSTFGQWCRARSRE